MVPVSDPKTWVPYMNTRDCSQGFCSLYCPQWCYIIFPPPPPFDFPEDNSGPSFSPLVIAIIGILASAFLLVSYYAIMSKYCGNRNASRRRENDQGESDDSDENQDPSIHDQQPWNAANTGLDEALIKSISVFKYKKGDGVIDGSDCSVCLSEFQEDENLRLLPKCSHAFHVSCIDTWLKSHSNCPLCRSNIVFLNASLPPPILEPPSRNEASVPENHAQNEEALSAAEEGSAENNNNILPKSPATEHAITIREDETQADSIKRRSVSMDFSCQGRLSIADILRLDHNEDCSFNEIGSSKQAAEVEISSRHSSHRQSVLSCVMNPAVMNRSFSSGRFLFPKLNRGPNTSILPS